MSFSTLMYQKRDLQKSGATSLCKISKKNIFSLILQFFERYHHMNENPLLNRLEGIEARFEEVSTLISDPDVISDRARYTRLTKEYRELERLVDATRRYKLTLDNISEANKMLKEEEDEEMRQFAKEDLEAAGERLPRLEEEIKMLLIPADPDDGKNAIVEIRGGTGGDEAALFAGDLSGCTRNMPRKKGGNWPCPPIPRELQEDSRRLSSRSQARVCME